MVIIVLRIYALHEYKLHCKYFRFAVYRVITLQAVAKWVKAATRVDDVSELLSELQMTGCKCYCRVYVCVSLVPRPFLVGEVRKGRGRKEWITQPQRQIHGISLMFNNLRTHEYLQVYRTHFKHVHSQNFSWLTPTRHSRFPSSTLTAGMQPWIRISVKLLTRPFLPLPFLTPLTRKGLGTKLRMCVCVISELDLC